MVTTIKMNKDELLEKACQFVEEVIKAIHLELSFHYEVRDAVIEVFLEGKDEGIVLSHNGRILYAINHLLNQVFFKQSLDGYNFVVDCDDYRVGRTAELQLLARKAAEKVCLSQTPFRLQPIPANERRIVHLALAEEPGIRTESEGQGLQRCVVILPSH